MKLETAQCIVACMNDEARVYEKYSGRGMYGRTTAGVVYSGSLGHLLEAVAQVATEIEVESREACDESDVVGDGEAGRAFIADLRNVRTDNMGNDTIAY